MRFHLGRPPALAASLVLLSAICYGQVKVGVGQRSITPDLAKFGPVYLAGFGNNRVATGVHDELSARCMAIAVVKEPVVICAVDLIGLFLDDTSKIRKSVANARVVVASLHDHEGPDTMGMWGPAPGVSGINEAYNQFVVDRTIEAARDAVKSLQPAKITLSKIDTPELHTFIDDGRPPVVHDAELIALFAVDEKGKPIGTLLNWANHPETLGSKNTLITADYSGYLRTRLEALLGGTAVFVNGAVGGMQSPLGSKLAAPENTFEKAELIGTRVAAIAAEAVKKAAVVEINALSYREASVQLPMNNAGFKMGMEAGLFKGRKKPNVDGSSTTTVGYMRLGQNQKALLEIALLPGELYPELSVGGIRKYEGADFPDAVFEAGIKKDLMKAPYRMLFGLANDEIGYVIPKVEWDDVAPWLQNRPKRLYGEVNSVGPETAPMIVKAFADLVLGDQ